MKPIFGLLGAAAAVITIAGGVLFACSGTSVDQACTDSAAATCTKLATCSPASLQTSYGDQATCESRLRASCTNSLSAPSTGAAPDKTEACAQAYPQWSCTDYLNHNNIPTACAQVTGALGSGSACAFAGQCQTGFCAIVPGSPCGTCAAMPKVGDSCAQLTTCGPSLACTSDNQQCVAYALSGAACGAGQPCGTGLTCVAPGGTGTPGTCQQAGTQIGATCATSTKNGPTCDGALGLFCDPQTQQCVADLYAGSGQPCGYSPDAGNYTLCTTGACVSSQCIGRAMDNGACVVPDAGGSATDTGCIPPARCIGGTCQTVSATNCH